MTKQKIIFWRIVLLTILLGGAILVGRSFSSNSDNNITQIQDNIPNTDLSIFADDIPSEENNNKDEEIEKINTSNDNDSSHEPNLEESGTDKEKSSTSLTLNKEVEEVIREEAQEEVKPIIVDQTITLNLRPNNFFDTSNDLSNLNQDDNKDQREKKGSPLESKGDQPNNIENKK